MIKDSDRHSQEKRRYPQGSHYRRMSSSCRSELSRLSLSQIQRNSLKYFEISVPRHIAYCRMEETNICVIGLLKLEIRAYIENIMEKRRHFS